MGVLAAFVDARRFIFSLPGSPIRLLCYSPLSLSAVQTLA